MNLLHIAHEIESLHNGTMFTVIVSLSNGALTPVREKGLML
jgi:hypothetical protein